MVNDTSFMPFARPAISEEAIQEVVECLRSGWITTGPRVQAFESLLSDYFGGPRAMAISSATAGLQLALLALKLKKGDEVITTPLTFVATLNTIVQAGGKPVLVDVHPSEFNINVKAIEAKITKRTRALMPVHFAGLPVDLGPIYALAKKHGLRVIEDCAHSIGAEYKGKKLGSFGDVQVFSFHPNKNMTTGEGGAVVSRDPALIKAVELMRFHGIDREVFNRFSKAGSAHYDVAAPGFKYNMMDIQAALGLHQLPALDGFIEKRTRLVQRYYALLKGWKQFALPTAPKYKHKHAWHLFTPLLSEKAAGMTRDEFILKMKEENIGIGLHYAPAHLFGYYRKRFGWKEGSFPNAEAIGERILSLPLFPTMTDADQDRVAEAMKRVFKR